MLPVGGRCSGLARIAGYLCSTASGDSRRSLTQCRYYIYQSFWATTKPTNSLVHDSRGSRVFGGSTLLLKSYRQLALAHQRRTYLYLPTSWTELRLRFQAGQKKQILKVKLLRKKLRNQLDESVVFRKALVDYSKEQYGRAKEKSKIWVTKGQQNLERRRSTLNIRRKAYQIQLQNRLQNRRGRLSDRVQAFLRGDFFKTRVVTLDEYFEKDWFDEKTGRPWTSRDATGRFVNPWQSQSTSGVKTAGAIMRWRWERVVQSYHQYGWRMMIPNFLWSSLLPAVALPKDIPVVPLEARPPIPRSVSDTELKLTWIGHATCLLQQGDITILTDPMFSVRASPYETIVGVARDVPPAYSVDDLPGIDLVIITHDHYDHLDRKSVIDLLPRVGHWVVPKGLSEWMQTRCGVDQASITELEWWESVKMKRNEANTWQVARLHSLRASGEENLHPSLDDPATGSTVWITCTPAQHWASRTFWDRNYRLWSGFAVYLQHHTFFFAGDSALPVEFPLFSLIRDYVGPIDLAALPIGAYLPDYMMQDAHMDPSEALKVHQILQAKKSIGIHWGTFRLSEEPFDEPPKLLKRCIREEEERQGDSIDFVTIPIGDSVSVLDKTSSRRS